MEILFTECPIASVLLADWSKYPIKVTVVQPAFLFLDCIWINPCSCSYLLQPDFFNLYNNWSNFPIFAVVTPIWLAWHFLILEFSFWKSVIYSNWSHSLYLWIGVNSSYFQIHSNSTTSVFISFGVHSLFFKFHSNSSASIFISFGVLFLLPPNCSESHLLTA